MEFKRVTYQSQKIEFDNLAKAEVFCTENDINFTEIETFEKVIEVENQAELRQEQELKLYFKRREDGVRMFLSLMAEMRLASINNNLPRAWLKNIGLKFERVRMAVESGQWVDAKEECEIVTTDAYVTQQLKDRIYNAITNYITENY